MGESRVRESQLLLVVAHADRSCLNPNECIIPKLIYRITSFAGQFFGTESECDAVIELNLTMFEAKNERNLVIRMAALFKLFRELQNDRII